jgi:hypothetical protein
MGAWTPDELQRVGEATELHIQTATPEGSLRSPIRARTGQRLVPARQKRWKRPDPSWWSCL